MFFFFINIDVFSFHLFFFFFSLNVSIRYCKFSMVSVYSYTYLKENHIHLKLSNAAADTASHSKTKRDGAKGIRVLTSITLPSFWFKGERFWEGLLIMTDSIVTKCKSSLEEMTQESDQQTQIYIQPG